MKKVSTILQKCFRPHRLLLILLMLVSAGLLAVIFACGWEDTAYAAPAYALSAYTLMVTVIRLMALIKHGKAILHRNAFLHRYITDMDYRAEWSLYLSLGVNLVYSAYKGAAGIAYRSMWFGAMAFYYMILSIVRFLLLRHIRGRRSDLAQAARIVRVCGYVLLVLAVAVSTIGFYAVHIGESIVYPEFVIYAAAGYTFYNVGTAVANLIRYRKQTNPLYVAGRVVSLATALVSLFFLQTALLTAFGDDGAWQKQMNTWTGGGVFALIVVMSVGMILYGDRVARRGCKSAEQEPGGEH